MIRERREPLRTYSIILILASFSALCSASTDKDIALIMLMPKNIYNWQNDQAIATQIEYAAKNYNLQIKPAAMKIKLLGKIKNKITPETMAALADISKTENLILAQIEPKQTIWHAYLAHNNYSWHTKQKINKSFNYSFALIKHHLHPNDGFLNVKVKFSTSPNNWRQYLKQLKLACQNSTWSVSKTKPTQIIFDGFVNKKNCAQKIGGQVL